MAKNNVIIINADDLGFGMLSCYGQKEFQTPNIDKIAESGMKFENFYGAAFCAPSRACMITGLHDCHAGGWTYNKGGIYKKLHEEKLSLDEVSETLNNSGYNYLKGEVYLPHVFKNAGYATGEIGKLEWGFAVTPQEMEKHGWDYHYGYYDHQMCHGFYPPYLFENGNSVKIEGNTHSDCAKVMGKPPKLCDMNKEGMEVYSQDLFDEKIVNFIKKNKDNPFFLYHPSQLPHGPVSIKKIHKSVENNNNLTETEKLYASMIIRLDDTVGLIEKTLKKYNLTDKTMVIFTGDNGHTFYYCEDGRSSGRVSVIDGTELDEYDNVANTEKCGDIFNGNGGLSGYKRASLQGGLRVPMLASMPSKIKANSTTGELVTQLDFMATFSEMLNQKPFENKDSQSFLPTLFKGEKSNRKPAVFASRIGPTIITNDGWKVRYIEPLNELMLYYLPTDPREENNLAQKNPEKLKELSEKLLHECDGNFYNGTPDAHLSKYISQFI
ncbi:MAG: sulfatase-like hydrolase/transferase [Clostridia bacterium]